MTIETPHLQNLEQITALPAFKLRAQWWPIYFEPLAGSGERITAFVALQLNDDSAPEIRNTLRADVLRNIYGRKSSGIQVLFEIVQESLRDHLRTHANPTGWTMPTTGFSIGSMRWAHGNTKSELLDQAVMMCASLGTVDAITSNEADSELVSEKWMAEIRLALPSPWTKSFNRKVNLSGESGWNVHIGFMTDRYAAQFGVLRPQTNRFSQDQLILKARMMDLAQLRGDLFAYTENREVIVGRPSFSDQSLSTSQRHRLESRLGFLEKEADAVNIRLLHTDSPKEAAAWITTKLAA